MARTKQLTAVAVGFASGGLGAVVLLLLVAGGAALWWDARDADDDGFVATEKGGDDCDDSDPNVYPAQLGLIGNEVVIHPVDADVDGVDQNCDGVDGLDEDGDGFAAEYREVNGKEISLGGNDCYDLDPAIFPYDRDGDGIHEGCGWTVSAGYGHTCGVSSSGAVKCWGDLQALETWIRERSGEPNNPNSELQKGQTSPPDGTFTQVFAGSNYSCGLTLTGSVECWGSDEVGQVSDAPTGTGYIAIDGTCAINASGTIECWGASVAPPTGTFTQLSGTCGVQTNGNLTCWGPDERGQDTPPDGTFTQVSQNYLYGCGVRTDETVACWGLEHEQEWWRKAVDLGQATPPAGTFTQVSVGNGKSCGVATSGVLVCWGEFSRAAQRQGYKRPVPPEGRFRSVDINNHYCGVTTHGQIKCWHSGKFAALRLRWTNPDGSYAGEVGVR